MREVQVPVELDDYDGVYVEVLVRVRVYPGEAPVRYYPDGSGYPGSPPKAVMVGMCIETAVDENDVEVAINGDILCDYLLDNEHLWYERALDYAEDYS